MKASLVSIGIGITAWMFIITVVHYGSKKIMEPINRTSIEMRPYIGKRVMIDKDSLTVVDYKPLSSVYVLSNRTEVARQIVER